MANQAYDDKKWQQELREVWDHWDDHSDDDPQQAERFEAIRETTRQQAYVRVSWLLDIVIPNCG